jgi:hypothetical protein
MTGVATAGNAMLLNTMPLVQSHNLETVLRFILSSALRFATSNSLPTTDTKNR